MNKGKKNQWKFILVGLLLSVAILFFYISRTQEGMIFFIVGAVLFILALLISDWVDKEAKD